MTSSLGLPLVQPARWRDGVLLSPWDPVPTADHGLLTQEERRLPSIGGILPQQPQNWAEKHKPY